MLIPSVSPLLQRKGDTFTRKATQSIAEGVRSMHTGKFLPNLSESARENKP